MITITYVLYFIITLIVSTVINAISVSFFLFSLTWEPAQNLCSHNFGRQQNQAKKLSNEWSSSFVKCKKGYNNNSSSKYAYPILGGGGGGRWFCDDNILPLN